MMLDKNGKETTDEKNAWSKSNNDRHYVRTLHGVLMNPHSYGTRNTKLQVCSKECYDYYVLFLQTADSRYLTRANASLIKRST